MDPMSERIDSKFRFVLLAATRAEQMLRGARPKVDQKGKLARIAMDEILKNLVEWDYGPAPVPEGEVGEEEEEEQESEIDIN